MIDKLVSEIEKLYTLDREIELYCVPLFNKHDVVVINVVMMSGVKFISTIMKFVIKMDYGSMANIFFSQTFITQFWLIL